MATMWSGVAPVRAQAMCPKKKTEAAPAATELREANADEELGSENDQQRASLLSQK